MSDAARETLDVAHDVAKLLDTGLDREQLAVLIALVERGVRSISKDLVWKLWFEAAQVEERAGNLSRSRAAYVQSVRACAPNLRWKVWLGGARTELCHRHYEVAAALLARAHDESPRV